MNRLPEHDDAIAATVLLVEDDLRIRQFVRTALRTRQYTVNEADSVQRALESAANCHPDLVILDLGLPDNDGVQFVQAFRDWSPAPVLILSARSDEHAKITALDAGADDYLTKPFAVGELLARVRALLRRNTAIAKEHASVIHFSNVQVDLARRIVSRGGETVHLTPIEYRLLLLLLSHAGQVMTHRHLLREIWGSSHAGQTHYLRVYVGHLRQKLEADAAQPRHFLTETGIGYRFVL